MPCGSCSRPLVPDDWAMVCSDVCCNGTETNDDMVNNAAGKAGKREEGAAAAAKLRMPRCLRGHELKLYTMRGGHCDGCERKLPRGSKTMDCRQCNYDLCDQCDPRALPAKVGGVEGGGGARTGPTHTTRAAPTASQRTDERRPRREQAAAVVVTDRCAAGGSSVKYAPPGHGLNPPHHRHR